jgi:hypothetical protein
MIRGLRKCRDADLAIAYRGLVREYLRLGFLVFIGLVNAPIRFDGLSLVCRQLSAGGLFRQLRRYRRTNRTRSRVSAVLALAPV